MSDMTVPQFEAWTRELAKAPDKWGLGTHRKIAAYLKRTHRKRLRGQRTPSGMAWKRTFVPDMPQVGDTAFMLLEDGTTVRETIKTRSGLRKAKAWRKKFGPPVKPQKAIVRTAGKKRFRARKVFDFLVTNALSTARTKRARRAAGLSTNSALSYSPSHLYYGYTPGTKWIERLQFGGEFKGGTVPPREMIGLNNNDINFIEDAYASALLKHASRL